jgi:hypothetical protein
MLFRTSWLRKQLASGVTQKMDFGMGSNLLNETKANKKN